MLSTVERMTDPPLSDPDRLRISEIFQSIQGEARDVGWPTVFVRLTGCPLRCVWCDTVYAFHGGELFPLKHILERVADFAPRHVTVTGGEPLVQPGCRPLLRRLCDAGYEVSLETSGALSIEDIDPRVGIVMDFKTPGSGESHRNRLDNLQLLRSRDQLKFVIRDRSDYEWSRTQVTGQRLDRRVEVLFSPVHGELEARELADWILADRLGVRLQIQLHKYLWGDAQGR